MKKLWRKDKAPAGRQRLVGGISRAPTSFSYHNVRADERLNTGRQLQREEIAIATKHSKSALVQRLQLLGLVLIIGAALVAVLNVSNNPRVIVLGSSDSRDFLQTTAVYQASAHQLLSKSIWNKNKLTVDTGNIASTLKDHFPELSLATVTVPLLTNQPVVYIESAEPALILVSSNGSFVLDQNGRALQRSDQVSAIARFHLPTVTDLSATTVQLDHQALSSSDVSFIQTVLANLSAKQVTYTTLTLPAASREFDVQLAAHSYHVKFNLESGDAQQQVGTFLAVMTRLQTQNITPAQYIDVRVDGRAYYQ